MITELLYQLRDHLKLNEVYYPGKDELESLEDLQGFFCLSPPFPKRHLKKAYVKEEVERGESTAAAIDHLFAILGIDRQEYLMTTPEDKEGKKDDNGQVCIALLPPFVLLLD